MNSARLVSTLSGYFIGYSSQARYLIMVLACLLAVAARAQEVPLPATSPDLPVGVPHLIKFSGVLPSATGTVGATFALYKDQTGGAPLWLETQNVVLDEKGRYTILLGANHAQGLPLALFISGEARWLGVQPEGQAELPRVLLVSVPYALKSADADTLGGRPLSAFVLSGDSTGTGADGLNYINTKMLQTATSTLYAGTPGTIAKFGADGSSMVSSILVENNGKIGVGTSAPSFTLDIQNTDASAAGAQLLNVQTSSSNGARIFFNSTAANGRAYGIGSNFISGQGEFGVYDYTAGVPRMVIGRNGFMGVGVPSPAYLLDLATTDTTATGSQLLQLTTPSVNGAKIMFNSTSENGRTYGFGSNFIEGQGEFGIYDYTAKATRLMVGANGNVGIGTTSPEGRLTVAGGDVVLQGSGNALVFPDGSRQTAAAMASFNGRSGVVMPMTGDYTFAQIGGTATLAQLPATVLNSTGTYSNPSWLTALDAAKITGTIAKTRLPAATVFSDQTNSGNLTISGKYTGDGSGLTNVAAVTASTATNALNLNGLGPSYYARRDIGNSFTGDQSISGSATVGGNVGVGTTATEKVDVAGNVKLSGAIKFGDGSSIQSGLGLVPSGFTIMGSSSTAPNGYSSAGWMPVMNPQAWTSKAPMPNEQSVSAYGVVNGKLYVTGGVDSVTTPSFTLTHLTQQYDPATDSWSSLAPMPTGRLAPASAVVNNKIYTFGGALDWSTSISVVEVYTPATNSWETKKPIPVALCAPVAAVVGTTVYLFGGDTSGLSGAMSASVLAYDTITDTWTTKDSMPIAARSRGAATVGNKVYVFAGVTAGGYTNRNDEFDPAAPAGAQWTAKQAKPTLLEGPPLVVYNNLIITMGGWYHPTGTSATELYDPASDTWITLPATPLPMPRNVAGLINGMAYVSSGNTNTEINRETNQLDLGKVLVYLYRKN